MRPLFTLSLSVFGKRVILEPYACGALYVRLGKRDRLIGEGRAMRMAARRNARRAARLATRTAGLGLLVCTFLASEATAHAAGDRFSGGAMAHHLAVGLLFAGGLFVWDCVKRKDKGEQ